MLKVGTTFLIPSGPGEFLHLFVVCSAQRDLPDMRILVPIFSKKDGVFFDPACEINIGEHSFITKNSFAHYKHIQQRSSSKIVECLENGSYISKPALSDELLTRILAGLKQSDFVEPWVFELID